jgi:hypothetical protein
MLAFGQSLTTEVMTIVSPTPAMHDAWRPTMRPVWLFLAQRAGRLSTCMGCPQAFIGRYPQRIVVGSGRP